MIGNIKIRWTGRGSLRRFFFLTTTWNHIFRLVPDVLMSVSRPHVARHPWPTPRVVANGLRARGDLVHNPFAVTTIYEEMLTLE
jgi:hypothetical protein